MKSLSDLSCIVQVALYRGEQESDLFELDGGSETTRVRGLFNEPNHVSRVKVAKLSLQLDENKPTMLNVMTCITDRRFHLSYPDKETREELVKRINEELSSIEILIKIDINPKADGYNDVYGIHAPVLSGVEEIE